MSTPSASWFAEMRALDRANETLTAQHAAFAAGDTWSVTIAPERRINETVVVARCRCGYASSRELGPGAFERAAKAAAQHAQDAHCGEAS